MTLSLFLISILYQTTLAFVVQQTRLRHRDLLFRATRESIDLQGTEVGRADPVSIAPAADLGSVVGLREDFTNIITVENISFTNIGRIVELSSISMVMA